MSNKDCTQIYSQYRYRPIELPNLKLQNQTSKPSSKFQNFGRNCHTSKFYRYVRAYFQFQKFRPFQSICRFLNLQLQNDSRLRACADFLSSFAACLNYSQLDVKILFFPCLVAFLKFLLHLQH